MYNPVYGVIREEMSAAAFGRDYKELEEHATVWSCVVYLRCIMDLS